VILLACSIPIGWAYAFHQDKASLVRVPVANVTLSSLAQLLRENTDSSSGDIVDLIGDEDPTDKDGDTEVLVSLGEISSKGKKSWESDISDCDNTKNGGKITGGGIGNMSYLTDYKEIDRGYVAFGGNLKGGKITRKCTIKTGLHGFFFLATKDETSGILKSFITKIENLVDYNVELIRCDNGTECKNGEMNQFCEMEGILKQFSVARTPQQNGVVDRMNRTLIEAARTMLADSKFPTTFWAEAVNTACYEKFNGKADEGFFVRYSLNSKAFRVFNSRTMIVEENMHIRFSESTPNVVGSGRDWLFDIDALIRTMNYEPIVAGTRSNGFEVTKANDNAYPKSSNDDRSEPSNDDEKKVDEDPRNKSECKDQEKNDNVNNTYNVNTVDVSTFYFLSDDEDNGAVADMNNLDTTIQVSPIPTTRIHKDHDYCQVIRDLQSATQTRKISKNLEEHGFEEPKKVIHALKDPSWIEAIQEELLQFKLQGFWTLVDLPNIKRAIGSKWVFRNKKDERRIVIKNKARLVAQGYTQEEWIDYDGVFTHEAIRLFLAYASFKDFVVCQMDVKMLFSMMIGYALWEVIENGETLPKTNVMEEVVEKRFGGNAATKKTQRNILKQQYENFISPSSKMLYQTFDRLQKLVSQLELLEEKLSQEDVNQKLLRSLSPEWNTHVVVWRNKADLDTMSMDDLYNNLKVYEPEVKGMFSLSSSTQNMAFVSSLNNNTSSTNGVFNIAQVVNTAHRVSTVSTQVNDAYSTNIDNLSDAVICSFFASQPNSP
nr:hypothetical protein [Tanacetum cinerariifolium]